MKRILFVATILLYVLQITTVSAQRRGRPIQDILLKGGHVIDPKNKINSVMDVLVRDGKIDRIDKSIPIPNDARMIDVSGYYVTPGFVDLHVHVFPEAVDFSVIARHHCFQTCVTTVVDAGTPGADNFEDFKKRHIDDPRSPRILAFLNIAASGMGAGENDPSQFNVTLAVETAKKYPDIIVGFKTAHYGFRQFDENYKPWTSVDSVLAAGRLAGLPCMLDSHPRPASGGYPPKSQRELTLEKMRPGDIYTHCYCPGFPIITKDGAVNPDLFKARERGVYFDVGHGGGAMVFRNAVPSIQQGFLPDAISTDLHETSACEAMLNMANTMSKFLCMGISLEDVIQCSTINPARIVNHPELGHLSVGAAADIAVFELTEGNFSYTDIGGGKISGNKKIVPFMTLYGGRIVFNPYGLGATRWEDIPGDSEYWVNYNHIDY
ncbi:amidohydrolase family protein [Candidatus Latescibacterota bacterium]